MRVTAQADPAAPETMFNLAFATCRTWPDSSDDERLAAEVLRGHGACVSAVIWDAPGVDWSGFDAVVIRSTWDYHLAADEFVSWARDAIRVASE